MDADDFRRIALSLDGVESGSHVGAEDFRVGGHIFATLAHLRHGYGNLMFTPEAQHVFIALRPDVFLPVSGGWGRNGATHLRLSVADEDIATEALTTAWEWRRQKNQKKRR